MNKATAKLLDSILLQFQDNDKITWESIRNGLFNNIGSYNISIILDHTNFLIDDNMLQRGHNGSVIITAKGMSTIINLNNLGYLALQKKNSTEDENETIKLPYPATTGFTIEFPFTTEPSFKAAVKEAKKFDTFEKFWKGKKAIYRVTLSKEEFFMDARVLRNQLKGWLELIVYEDGTKRNQVIGIWNADGYNLFKEKLKEYKNEIFDNMQKRDLLNCSIKAFSFSKAPYFVSLLKVPLELKYNNHTLAVKKLISPDAFRNIDNTLPYEEYLNYFYELHENKKESYCGLGYKLETYNDWINRCKAQFNYTEVYCLKPIILADHPTTILSDGKVQNIFVPDPQNIIKLYNLILGLCNDLKLLGIKIALILPPKNDIDDIIETQIDAADSWKNEPMWG